MVEDPLKPIDDVLEPDQRSDSFVGGLKVVHDELVLIALNAAVPEEVQQLFETAKNVSLYSWFVYRFHQVAESVAFQALELGLRKRCATDPKYLTRQRHPNLRNYLVHAASRGWISNAGFSNVRGVAVARARMRKFVEVINNDAEVGGSSVPEPTEADVEKELTQMTLVARLVRAIPVHRNALAHGSPMLSPTSRIVLRVVADILNQLYSAERS